VPLMTIIIMCSCSKELPKTFYLRNIFYQMPGLRLRALRGGTSPLQSQIGMCIIRDKHILSGAKLIQKLTQFRIYYY
jgi:hypothetical protein